MSRDVTENYAHARLVKDLVAVEAGLQTLRWAVTRVKAEPAYPMTADQQAMIDVLFKVLFADEAPKFDFKSGDGTFWEFHKFIA